MGGEWKGHLISSKKPEQEIPIIITIYQTYSNIRVRLETESKSAKSYSLMAGFKMIDPAFFNLSYEYLSEFRSSEGELFTHYGVAKLDIKTNNDKVNSFTMVQPNLHF